MRSYEGRQNSVKTPLLYKSKNILEKMTPYVGYRWHDSACGNHTRLTHTYNDILHTETLFPQCGNVSSDLETSHPLWDGGGCGPTGGCCESNNPPWFCKTLPQPTTDDIEVRVCGDEVLSNEDILVELIEIYVN